MAYFRCSAGNSGDGGIFPPQGKMFNGGVYDFASSASLTTWGGTLIFNGKDLEGKRLQVFNRNSRDLIFRVRYIKNNAVKSTESSSILAGENREFNYINDVDLAICDGWCRVNTTSSMSLTVQVED